MSLVHYILPGLGILLGLFLLFVEKRANYKKGLKIFNLIGSLLVIAISIYILVPTKNDAPDWQKFSESKYKAALADNEKIIIDFYADWCIPCKELDAKTFSEPKVVEQIDGFAALKVDMTETMSEETEKMRNEFGVMGLPTVLIFDSQGNEAERLTGYVDAGQFLKMISDVN